MRRLHPKAGLLNTSMHQYRSALAELGLTPSSRSRVSVLPAAKKKASDGIKSFFGKPPTPSA
ncbi:MAG: P27 family phage terminase small subunit [Nitrospiraceae bacterium]|nr:P27 family phage terminase small subunit [Nitrospiraceae bacterium]